MFQFLGYISCRSRRRTGLVVLLGLAVNIQRSSQLHIVTPLVQGPILEKNNCEIWYKLDCLQPPGSFKLRGLGKVVENAKRSGAAGVVSSSGGNAGIATAYAAKACGLECLVVLPITTPKATAEKLKLEYGASVIIEGDVWDTAHLKAQEISKARGWPLVHPFDDPTAWEGHASLVDECFEQLSPKIPHCFITSVGGGGLLAGVLTGIERNLSRFEKKPTVIAVETHGADSFAQSFAAGKPITLDAITSIAKSLGARTPSSTILTNALQLSKDSIDLKSLVVSDEQALRATIRFANEYRHLVEPACGAALAAIHHTPSILPDDSTIVVEVCGGAVVDLPAISKWASDLGLAEASYFGVDF